MIWVSYKKNPKMKLDFQNIDCEFRFNILSFLEKEIKIMAKTNFS